MSSATNGSGDSGKENAFFKALVAHLMEGAMIPKVQVERSIGPVLGFFMPDVMTELLGKNVVMLSPEFPICKDDNKQSTNIDWLMLDLDTPQLLLVELKTTDTTFRASQATAYSALQKLITENSGAFLLDDLQGIQGNSKERGKYQNVCEQMQKACGVSSEPELRDILSKCFSTQVIYILPEVIRERASETPNTEGWKWLSFEELAAVKPPEWPFFAEWQLFGKKLEMLDTLDIRKRNAAFASPERMKFEKPITFTQLVNKHKDAGTVKVIGFINWKNELMKASPESLGKRLYKVEDAANTKGRVVRNWIPCDEFFRLIADKNVPGNTPAAE